MDDDSKPDNLSAAARAGRSGKGRSFRRRAVIFLPILYVAWVSLLYLFQDWIIFAGEFTSRPLPEPPRRDIEVLKIDVGGQEHVEAWFHPAPGCDAEHPKPAVAFFHGNSELIDYQDAYVRAYHKLGWSVLLQEYRGFGRSGGHPSQRALREDNARFYDLLVQRPDVDASHIVFHGRSLGGGVAADLTTVRRPSGLILQSTFSSITAMAHRFAVPGFITRHPFRTDHAIEHLDIPVMIFHGKSDLIVPVSHARRLHRLRPDATYVEYACGHNNLPPAGEERAHWQRIETFLARCAETVPSP